MNTVHRRLPEIDSLRALAVSAVVLYHLDARLLPGGFAGVDVFFVISGYVVTRALAAHVDEGWATFLGGFYARRVRRIVPALLVCLGLTLLLDTLFVPQAWLSSRNFDTARYALVGLSNVFLANHNENYFSPRIEFNPYAHTWSLGVEEQFYVVLPLLYFGARRLAAGERATSRWIAAFCIASFVWSAIASANEPAAAYYGLTSRFWELGLGAWLAERHRLREGPVVPWRRVGATAAVTGALALIVIGLCLSQRVGFPIPWAMPATFGSALFIDSLRATSVPHRWLGIPAVVYVGRISYSAYLWHWPVFCLARWTVGLDDWITRSAALTAVAVLSIASYHGVEKVFQEARGVSHRFAIAAALAAVASTVMAADALHARAYAVSLSVTRDARTWYPENWYSSRDGARCHGVQHREAAGEEVTITIRRIHCDDAAPVPTLFVLGDSHATAYLTTFGKLVNEHAVNVELSTRAGCPSFSLDVPLGDVSGECAAFIAESLHGVATRAKPGDVLFLPSLRLTRFVDQWGAPKERPPRTREEAASLRRRAVAEAIEALRPLQAANVDVVFEAPKPIFAAPAFRCTDWFNRNNPVCVPGFSMESAALRTYREPVMRDLQEIQRAIPEVRIWDPFDTLCPGAACEAFEAGTPLFQDTDHLSAAGAEKLYPSFAAFIGFERRP